MLDPSDPGWASFEEPEGFRAAVREADLDDAGWDRWLEQLVAWGFAETREGKRGPEFAITPKGIEWVEAGLPALPPDHRSRVAVETVLADGREVAEFLAQHDVHTLRDEIVVIATWFKMREKETFTPADVGAVLEKLGRQFSLKWLQMELAALASEDSKGGVGRGHPITKRAHGIYAITPKGIARSKRLLRPAEAQTLSSATPDTPPATLESETATPKVQLPATEPETSTAEAQPVPPAPAPTPEGGDNDHLQQAM